MNAFCSARRSRDTLAFAPATSTKTEPLVYQTAGCFWCEKRKEPGSAGARSPRHPDSNKKGQETEEVCVIIIELYPHFQIELILHHLSVCVGLSLHLDGQLACSLSFLV